MPGILAEFYVSLSGIVTQWPVEGEGRGLIDGAKMDVVQFK